MQKVAEIWYCSFDELVSLCGVNPVTVKMGIQRDSPQWQAIPDPSDRRKRLIRYETMAEKYKVVVRRVLCGGHEPGGKSAEKKPQVLSERSLSELLEMAVTEEYRRYLGLFEVTGDERYRERRKKCLARAAAVVETLGTYIEDRDISWKSYAPFEEAAAWLLECFDDYFPYKDLPTSAIRLKAKVVDRFLNGRSITDVVRLLREGNNNREGQHNALFESWFVQQRMLGENPSDDQIVRRIRQVAQMQGIDCPSNTWFSNLAKKPLIKRITASGRHGKDSARARMYQSYLPTKGALFAGDCWMMDGTRVNFVEHSDGQGGFQFLYQVVVYDVYSGDILGVHYDTKEDRWAYLNALKMAVSNQGYLPYQLVYDRFPGHNTPEMETFFAQLESHGVKLTKSSSATDKAFLERWFGTYQTVFLSESKYYYGEGIQSTRAYNHRSAEYLSALRNEVHRKGSGWTFTAAWMEANKCLERYRQTPVSEYSKKAKSVSQSPAHLHEECDKPFAYRLRNDQIVSLFWFAKELGIRNNMIKMEVHKQEVFYPITDWKLLKEYQRVKIRYDETDLSEIHAFDPESDSFLGTIKQGQAAALYGPGAEFGKLAKHKSAAKELKEKEREFLEQYRGGADEISVLLKGREAKDVTESAESRWLMDRMPALEEAKRVSQTISKQAKQPVSSDSWDDNFDVTDFTRSQY